jgi:phospholipid/cholesterol/gamma-HCH transport system permease protein
MADAWLTSVERDERLLVDAGGGWTLAELMGLDRARAALVAGLRPAGGVARIGLESMDRLDTAGAWLLHRLERELAERGWRVELAGVRQPHAALLDEIRRAHAEPAPAPPRVNPLVRLVAGLGQGAIHALDEGRRLLAFYGQTLIVLARVLVEPRRLRLTSITHHLEQTCVNALPIVGLIAFLIGVVMAYQGADQLRRLGAEIFTVDLLGIAILREIGILLTSIVVAGRSGSAFTAQIGAMQVNEEIDAMRTIGLDPIEVLVVPRMLALMIALPLLAFFSDVLGLFGGGLMCALALGIPPAQFLAQLDAAITVETFLVGLVKAPVFAFLIAMVGCYEGLKVERNAESVGRLTTQSVVVGIFLVIVFDALFSVLFSYLGV